MLFERWRQIARAQGNALALLDLASGQRWRFSDLARQAEDGPAARDPVICPQGHSPAFIFDVLRAWRGQVTVCPLEVGQAQPAFPLPPAPCRHLKTTSATTGKPRAIAFTPEQLAADADQIVAVMGLRPDWPNLGVISLAHSYGFSNLVLPLLLHGIPLILAPSPLPEAVRLAAAPWPALTLAAVPAFWQAWHQAAAIPSQVRLAISAGAPLPASLEQAVFGATGLKIHNFYGSSECGGIAYDGTDRPRGDATGVGARLPGVTLTLNPAGCLQVRGAAVGQTYWPEPDPALGQGCFQTSDLAELREEQVHLCGRLGDLINVAGRKVSPAAIEDILREHPAVRECLVFGVPSQDASRTDSIAACVAVLAPTGDTLLREFLLARLPGWQVPREWWFLEDLPAGPRGKLSRAAWRDRFLQHRAAATRA